MTCSKIEIDAAFHRGYVSGAASRDAEIAELKSVPMKYRRMAFNAQLQDENNELREQVKMLHDALGDFDKAAINSKSIIGFAGQSVKLLKKMRKALAATEYEKPIGDNFDLWNVK